MKTNAMRRITFHICLISDTTVERNYFEMRSLFIYTSQNKGYNSKIKGQKN